MPSPTAALLPNGEQQFCDQNGVPYAGGSVYFYIPNTNTLQNTWQDPFQVTLNANPVVLNAAGRAIIYGSGQYRQVLYDYLGNLVWDQLTQGNLPGATANFTGDSGAGGVAGLVPAPPAGSAAAADVLLPGGTWGVPSIVTPAVPGLLAPGLLYPQTRTGATPITLQLSDVGNFVQYASVGGGVLNIPTDINGNWQTGAGVTQIGVYNQKGSGNLTITPAAGVSLYWPGTSSVSANRVLAANGQCLLSRMGANLWTIIGVGIT